MAYTVYQISNMAGPATCTWLLSLTDVTSSSVFVVWISSYGNLSSSSGREGRRRKISHCRRLLLPIIISSDQSTAFYTLRYRQATRKRICYRLVKLIKIINFLERFQETRQIVSIAFIVLQVRRSELFYWLP